MSLLEVIVASIILVTLLSLCLQVMQSVGSQQRTIRQRELATQEAANVMERLMANDWATLTSEAAGQLALSAETRRALPEGKLAVEIAPAAGPPESKRVHVSIAWPRGPEQPDQRVDLVAWKYRKAAAP
jgi:type II secretory pathway pseudopilin PulG